MAKRNKNSNFNVNTSNEPAVHLTRREEELRESEEPVTIVKPYMLDASDFENIARQCNHNNFACQVGNYTATLAKYAVFYRNRWFFVVYNRDQGKVVSEITYDLLSVAEVAHFNSYKNRLENERRIEILRNLKRG